MGHHGDDKLLAEFVASVYEKVRSKTKFFQDLKTHPAIISCNPYDSDWHQGFAFGVDRYAPHTDVWSISLGTGFGSFKLHISDTAALRAWAEEQERAIVPKKDPPAKVVAKMVALRIQRACMVAEKVQEQRQNTHIYLEGQIKQVKAHIAHPKPGFNMQQLQDNLVHNEKMLLECEENALLSPESTPAELLDWATKLYKAYSHEYLKDLIEFLARPDVTEEMVRMALDMLLVKEIHNA
jgi:hypothetical protein